MTKLQYKAKPVGWKSQFTTRDIHETLKAERKWSHNAANLSTKN